MLIKHKILDELYQIQLLDKRNNVTLSDVSLNLDALRRRVKGKEKDFQAALELLSKNKEIYVNWNNNIATIQAEGIASLSLSKYKQIHITRQRERKFYWAKMVGVIATFITIIIGIFKLVDYFTKQQ